MEDVPPKANWNPVNIRFALWEISCQVIEDNWLSGVGIGHLDETFKDYYTRNKFEFGLSNHFNSHNQFLQTFIILGISGFIVLVFVFLTSFKLALVKKDVLMFVFFSTFLLFSISESTLTVNKGVVFFSFFLSFFTFLPEKSSIYLTK
jgi:O-antigen ligase